MLTKILNLPFILIIGLFFILSTSLLLDEPYIWPDEALYGDIAKNLSFENRLGTDLLKGLIYDVEKHAYWIPPLFMYLNSLFFKIFGHSLEVQRLLSVFLGAVLLMVFYQLSKNLINSKNKSLNQILPLTACLLLAVDEVFLKASRLSRPEILVLLLIITALFFYLKALNKKSHIILAASGLALGLSVITHLIAVAFVLAFGIHFLYNLHKKVFNLENCLIFLVALSAPIIIWIASVLPHFTVLTNQLNLISESRNFTIPWYITVYNLPFLMKVNYLIYILISVLFLLLTSRKPNSINVLLSLILVSVWLFVTLGEIYWYTVYFAPFSYLAGLIIASNIFGVKSRKSFSKAAKNILISILFISLFVNLVNFYKIFNLYYQTDAYEDFKKQIVNTIPEGKTVFLTSIPDAYFALNNRKNILYEYPAFYAEVDDFKKILNQSDYVIFNGMYSPDSISKYLDQYLARNTETVKEFLSPYPVMIIKLKEKEARII